MRKKREELGRLELVIQSRTEAIYCTFTDPAGEIWVSVPMVGYRFGSPVANIVVTIPGWDESHEQELKVGEKFRIEEDEYGDPAPFIYEVLLTKIAGIPDPERINLNAEGGAGANDKWVRALIPTEPKPLEDVSTGEVYLVVRRFQGDRD